MRLQLPELASVLESTAFDAKAITLEKLGVTSDVSLHVEPSPSHHEYLVQPAYLSFAVQEALKNALGRWIVLCAVHGLRLHLACRL